MNTYQIGDLTMEYVFRLNGLTNVSDWQAVLDAMERALEYKNGQIRKAYAHIDNTQPAGMEE